jgi:hypothetical protein
MVWGYWLLPVCCFCFVVRMQMPSPLSHFFSMRISLCFSCVFLGKRAVLHSWFVRHLPLKADVFHD